MMMLLEQLGDPEADLDKPIVIFYLCIALKSKQHRCVRVRLANSLAVRGTTSIVSVFDARQACKKARVVERV